MAAFTSHLVKYGHRTPAWLHCLHCVFFKCNQFQINYSNSCSQVEWFNLMWRIFTEYHAIGNSAQIRDRECGLSHLNNGKDCLHYWRACLSLWIWFHVVVVLQMLVILALEIQIFGSILQLKTFLIHLKTKPPPHASIPKIISGDKRDKA